MPITTYKLSAFAAKIADLDTRPTLSADAFKAAFDACPEELRGKLNGLIDFLITYTDSDSGADNIGCTTVVTGGGNTVQSNLEKVYSELVSATLGAIPNDSITNDKMVAAMKKGIEGGVAAYDDLVEAAAYYIPFGFIGCFAANEPPTYFLECDGSAISRTTYATLFSAIGTVFGVGDGSTTFNLPDLRGEFIRGWDNGRGIDVDRVFGSAQEGTELAYTSGTLGVKYNSGGDEPASESFAQYDTTGAFGGFNFKTRPRNIALLVCIKY